MQTASTWDSYQVMLLPVLDALAPARVFEYGMGKSTEFFHNDPNVVSLDSVEHSGQWVTKYKHLEGNKTALHYERVSMLYPIVQGRYAAYEIIFIDGKERARCLAASLDKLTKDGAVILHDAERDDYREGIALYRHSIWGDDGHTVVLTNSEYTSDMIRRRL